jgi:predicted SprT family Zn-dependent metalloprotease
MPQAIRRENPNREYVTLSTAFDFFNRRLFAGKLSAVLITMQRKAGAKGYYSAKRFEGRADTDKEAKEADEIALNPGTFKECTDEDILSTLVHEMAHHWQSCNGNPGRGRYHNSEWADKMESLGLMPTSTGKPGGSRTGQRVTHYIIARGPFDKACKELLAGGARVEWQSREAAKVDRSKTKYVCPSCALNAWAKPGVYLICGNCGVQLEGQG